MLVPLEGLVLRLVAEVLRVRVTSWFRSVQHNAEVGGAPKSLHLVGGAIDVGAETDEFKRGVLRLFGHEIDERAKKNHWHYQVDGRSLLVVGALGVLVTEWWREVKERGR